jgi:hypothetical protein
LEKLPQSRGMRTFSLGRYSRSGAIGLRLTQS